MEKGFIPYAEALALKELGFDEPCLLFIQYSSGTDVYTRKKYKNSIWLGNGYDAEIGDKKIKYKFPKHSGQGYGTLEIPLYQQAFRWLLVLANKDEHFSNKWTISYNEDYYSLFLGGCNMGVFKAELECLKKLIELVKNK